MARNTVRMRDIADQLHVSVVTVSKALAGKDGVSDQLRQKIQETAATLGYATSATLRAHLGTHTIGILVAEHLMKPEHSFYWALYLSLVEALTAHSHHSMFELVRTQEPPEGLPVFLAEGRVDGVIVLGALPLAHMRRLESAGVPLVQVDSYTDGVRAHAVMPNSFWGCTETTRYLLRNGHQKIGFVGDMRGNVHSRDCFYGYLKALNMQDLEVCPSWVLSDRDGAVFRQDFDLPAQMPTAYVCSSDQGAYHFLRYLQRKGFSIPEDVSVVGFYGYVFSTLVTPQLTTYRIDMDTMAVRAVDALLARIGHPDQEQGLSVVCGTLLERQSVRTLNSAGNQPGL